MRLPGRRGGKRCPECGVENKAGLKYCNFCGTKLEEETALPPPVKKPANGAALGLLKGLAVACLAAGLLVYAGKSLRERRNAPVPPPSGLEGERQAAATCEAAIRGRVRAPFRVIAFRSSLVAAEVAGYAVSGTVELQSTMGEVQRKRYFCRVHPDARTGMVLDEGRME